MTLEAERTDQIERLDDGEQVVESFAAGPPADEPPVERVPELRLALVVVCPVIAAAMMSGGVFLGAAPRVWAAIAGVLGVALGVRASRVRRQGLLYATILGGVILIGLLPVIPTGFGNVTGLGGELRIAVTQSDVLRPPVEFVPGWRAILAWIMGALGFTTAWLAIELRRPALGLLVSLPVVGIGAISVPEAQQLATGLVCLVLFVLGLGLLSGTQTLGEDDQPASLAYEARRALRALPLIALVTVGLYFAARSDFLFPAPLYDPAQEARLPRTIPLSEVEDRVLFDVDARFTGPWKMGSLDVYDGEDWRLPPFDDDRLVDVPESGIVNPAFDQGVGAVFTVKGLGGAILPSLPNTVGIRAVGPRLTFDPRAGNIRLDQGQIEPGLELTVTAPAIPTIERLRRVQSVPEEVEEFREIPAPPPAVSGLLTQAPDGNLWDRLDFLRQRLLQTVIASGSGTPVPVPPDKVEDMLSGSNEGTPFEIVAGQALLARWAGIPSRIGYGFDGGDEGPGGLLEVRPRHGAAWLEVFFDGFGWLPIIGDPLQAQESFSDAPQQFNPRVAISEDVSVQLFVPVATPPDNPFIDEVRNFVLRVLPIIAVLALIYYLWPLPFKAYRRARRRSWASDRGPAARVALAYAEWRDHCTDFGYRHQTDTPLMYLERVIGDEEHAELAWLVTRGLWGDLQGEIMEDEALAADELAKSLRRRLSQAHAATLRIVAALSRLSVRHPYAPNLDAVPHALRRKEERVPAAT